jgi:hypothetical protein
MPKSHDRRLLVINMTPYWRYARFFIKNREIAHNLKMMLVRADHGVQFTWTDRHIGVQARFGTGLPVGHAMKAGPGPGGTSSSSGPKPRLSDPTAGSRAPPPSRSAILFTVNLKRLSAKRLLAF